MAIEGQRVQQEVGVESDGTHFKFNTPDSHFHSNWYFCLCLYHNMIHVYSSPIPLPPIEYTNAYHTFFHPTSNVPLSHVVHIDASTGAQTTRGELIDRIRRAATAFVADLSQGGLGIRKGETVGILSENSGVCPFTSVLDRNYAHGD